MLLSAKRRLAMLERSTELPLTVECFLARVKEHVRLTGASLDEAFRSLLVSLSDENLVASKKNLCSASLAKRCRLC